MSDTQRTLLIVDDSTVNRILLANIFQDRFSILEASNGQEALDLLRSHVDTVSAMLLDLMMPVMSGYEVLKKVAEDTELSKIPIIVISGADQKEEITALQLGVSDFVLKPFEPTITAQRVDNVVRHRELEEMRTQFLLLQKQTEAEVHLDAIISNLPGAVFTLEVVESHFEFRYYNEMICRLSAFDDIEQFDEVTKGDPRPLIYGPDYNLLERELMGAYHDASARAEAAIRLVNPEGELHWVRLIGSARTDPSAKKLLYCVAINIDKEKEQERVSQQALADLKFRAEFDSLTRIYNADAFYDNTLALLTANPDTDYTILCWNIEQFKLLNSFVSRELADDVLKEIAGVLVRNVAPIGAYGRIGGDRFAACIPSSLLDVSALLRQAEERFAAIGLPGVVNLATGLYDHADPLIPITRMCDCAILAMQSIKGNYLTRVAHYDERLQEQALLESEIANDMQRALANGEFVPYFQPIYNLRDRSMGSAEVLVRWIHPTKGLIPPGVFVPLFERNGFITKLDPYIWEQTCRFLRQRIDDGKPVVPLSVNISRTDLFNPALSESIIALVDRYGLDHSLVCLEITESAYTDKPDRLVATVQNLRSHGFTVLMDDFGSGYSSLNTLKDLPVDVLKIDMKFLEGFDTTDRAGNIVASVIRLASWLNLTTVAEGVETREQVEFLRSVGCGKIQGYFFARPMPLEDFSAKLDELENVHPLPGTTVAPITPEDDNLLQSDLNYLLSSPQLFSAMLDRLPFGCALYSLSEDERLELIRANIHYPEITGIPSATEETTDVLIRMDDGNRRAVLEALHSARRNGSAEHCVVERRHYDGHMLKLDCTFCSIGGSDQFPFFVVFFDEVR